MTIIEKNGAWCTHHEEQRKSAVSGFCIDATALTYYIDKTTIYFNESRKIGCETLYVLSESPVSPLALFCQLHECAACIFN